MSTNVIVGLLSLCICLTALPISLLPEDRLPPPWVMTLLTIIAVVFAAVVFRLSPPVWD